MTNHVTSYQNYISSKFEKKTLSTNFIPLPSSELEKNPKILMILSTSTRKITLEIRSTKFDVVCPILVSFRFMANKNVRYSCEHDLFALLLIDDNKCSIFVKSSQKITEQ